MLDMLDDILHCPWCLVVVGGVVAVFGLIVFAAVAEDQRWQEFASTHECRVVGKERGGFSTGFGVTASGKPGTVFIANPDKTGYACNDGVTYWR